MKRRSNLRILTWVVISYLLLAFTWWAVLLFMKNNEVYETKKEVLRLELKERNNYDPGTFQQTAEFKALYMDHKWQRWMILGEASFFIISLIIGVWMINRGYHQLVSAADQQRNFLLAITHELKSPLASIRLTLETISKRDIPPEKVKTISQKAMGETERLDHLVNNLLLAAKMEHGFQPSYEEVDLNHLLPKVKNHLNAKYPEAHFDVFMDTEEHMIESDRLGLTSILINLLENAVKYSPEGSVVALRVLKNNEEFIFEVADKGPGIPDDEKELVFDKFYRIGSEDTRKTKGTGLGLYIVHRMVTAQNGTVRVEDNDPRGARFIVSLPQFKAN